MPATPTSLQMGPTPLTKCIEGRPTKVNNERHLLTDRRKFPDKTHRGSPDKAANGRPHRMPPSIVKAIAL